MAVFCKKVRFFIIFLLSGHAFPFPSKGFVSYCGMFVFFYAYCILGGDWHKGGGWPVALIPKSPSSYEFISPGENIRQVLTAKEASELATEAHQFYRLFPDASLSLYIFAFVLIFLLSVFFIGKKIQNRQRNIIELQNNIFGMLIQFFSSISKIRIAGAESHAFLQWAGKFSMNKRETYEVRKLFMIVMQISTALPLIIILFVFGMISLQIPNTLSTGQFMAFFAALTLTVAAVHQLGMAMVSF